jgi:NADPH-dependent curcumin reductase CurA
MPGLTAWVGLHKIAEIKEGDVVFVSAAAGAVGSVACQLAKAQGCTVIGSAGGADKLEFLKEIGVDHGFDYREEPDLAAALARVAPKGIDVYFDNVGGDHLEAALQAARPFARFAMCGAISQYNDLDAAPGPKNLFYVIGKRLKLQGFIVSDHFGETPRFLAQVSVLARQGKLTWRETVDHGIEAAPGAFIKLFTGGNIGKMLVKLGD